MVSEACLKTWNEIGALNILKFVRAYPKVEFEPYYSISAVNRDEEFPFNYVG